MSEKMAPRQFLKVLIPLAMILFVLVIVRWGHETWTEKTLFLNSVIELRELQLNKYTRIAENSGNYEAVNLALQRLQTEIQQKNLFYAASESLAQARFQSLVKNLAGKNLIDIRSTRVNPIRHQDDMVLLSLRIDAKAEIGAIRDFLLDLRSDPHYIFVSDLEIRIINSREDQFYYLTAGLVAIQDV